MKLDMKNLAQDLVVDLIGGFLIALGVYNFTLNANFAPAGVNGIAVILNYLFGFNLGITILVFNIPIILLSYRLLGKVFLLKSIKTMVIGSLMMDVVAPLLPTYSGDPLLAAICTAVLSGIGYALIYVRGSSTGGTDFLTMSVRAIKPYLSIGKIAMCLDSCVILVGGLVFRNVDAVIYGLICTFCTSTMVDKIMYGLGAGKLLLIVTDHGYEVAKSIERATDRGATILRAEGSYSQAEKQVVMCACDKKQITLVRDAAHQTDSNSFIIVTESNEVFGEGFKRLAPSHQK